MSVDWTDESKQKVLPYDKFKWFNFRINQATYLPKT